MTLANWITSSRIFLSPVFLLFFFLPELVPGAGLISIVLLWLLIIAIELSDLFDGKVARARGEVSDLGKLLDPFADSFSRLSYFLAFLVAGYLPLWVFVPVLYRDLFVSFFRLLIAKRGTAMAARLSGKIKAWVYAVAGFAGLLQHSLHVLGAADFMARLEPIFLGIYVVTGLTALWTLWDYSSVLRKGADGPGTTVSGSEQA